MRRARATKRIAVVEVDSAVSSVDVDWQRILTDTSRDISRATAIPETTPEGSIWTTAVPRERQDRNGWPPVGQVEEVAFSKVAVDSEIAVQHDMEDAFARAREAIEQYRDALLSSEATLAKFEEGKSDIDMRVAELEVENEELQLSLLSHSRADVPSTEGKGRARRRGPGQAAGPQDDRTREALRRGLLDNGHDSALDEEQPLGEALGRVRDVVGKLSGRLPFERDLLRVRSQLGAAAGAYFHFMRSIIVSFLLLAVIAVIAGVVHVTNLHGSVWGYLSNTITLLPKVFYISTFSKKEGPFLICLILFNIVCVLFDASWKLFREDKVSKYFDASKSKDDHVHCDVVLASWDNSLAGSTAAEVASHAATEARIAACRELVAKAAASGRKADDSVLQSVVLVGKRVLGATAYICIQGTCYVVMSYLTTVNFSVGSSGSKIFQICRVATAPVVLSLYNNISPYAFRTITKFEEWGNNVELWVLSARLFLSVLANLIIIGVSYGLLTDSVFLAEDSLSFGRRRLEQEFFPDTYECRLNQAASGLLVTVVVDLVVFMAFRLLLHPVRRLTSILFSYEYRSLEFSVADSMIGTLYFLGLIVMAIPFMPLILIVVPIAVVLRFKFETFTSLRFFVKSTTSLPPTQVRKTFSVYYFLTVAFVGVCSTCFFLATRTFPKLCEIQDRSVGLCTDEVDVATELCSLDENSPYYDLYSDESYCAEGYPLCLCSEEAICGPFVDEYAAIDPLRRYAKSYPSVAMIWYLVMEGSAVAWLCLVVAVLSLSFRTNSYSITEDAKAATERKLFEQVDSLTKNIQKQNKIISRARDL